MLSLVILAVPMFEISAEDQSDTQTKVGKNRRRG